MKKKENKIEYGSLEEYSEIRAASSKTSVEKKMLNYVYMLLTEDKLFKKAISDIRAEHGIPKSGIPKTHKTLKLPHINEVTVLETYSEKIKNPKRFDEKLEQLAEEYGLTETWENRIKFYTIYNDFDSQEQLGSETYDMFQVIDINSFLNGPFQWDEEEESSIWVTQRLVRRSPVALLLNPHMSERDILDAVRNLYKVSIEPLLKQYRKVGTKAGNIRTRNERVAKRNTFIFDNATKPKKELITIVREKFGDVLDQSYLNRIIRAEREKRKQV